MTAVYVVETAGGGDYGSVPAPTDSDVPPASLARMPGKPVTKDDTTCCRRLMAFLLAIIALSFVVLLLGSYFNPLGTDKSQQNEEEEEQSHWMKWLEGIDFAAKAEPQFERFILTEPMVGNIGSQMYRFASLYAMGQMLNRTPVYAHDDVEMREMEAHLLAVIFPHFYEQIYFLANFNELEKVPFAQSCCVFHSPKKLLAKSEARALMLTGDPGLENHKYFHAMRKQILELFKFSAEMVKNATNAKKQMLKDDDIGRPTLCVQTRASDLVHLKAEQIAGAIGRVLSILPRISKSKAANNNKKFVLLLFGEEKKFLQSIQVADNQTLLANTHYVVGSKMSAEQQLCFARQSCDAVLLTASLSPQAFWMGYLMAENRPVFYVRKLVKLADEMELDTLELLPPDWMPIDENWL